MFCIIKHKGKFSKNRNRLGIKKRKCHDAKTKIILWCALFIELFILLIYLDSLIYILLSHSYCYMMVDTINKKKYSLHNICQCFHYLIVGIIQ